jgi:hypothetical protein
MDALVEYYAHALHLARIGCSLDHDWSVYGCDMKDRKGWEQYFERAWQDHRSKAEKLVSALEKLENA